MLKLLTPGMARLGKIVIGEKAAAPGHDGVMLPKKLDHFLIKTLQRDPTGQLLVDQALMERLGERPTSLRIRLPFNAIEMNFHTTLSYYRSHTRYCSGDGEQARRLQGERPPYGPAVPFGPCGEACPDFVARRCKPLGILRVVLEEQQQVGGVYEFRTTSWNSLRNILSSLATIKAQTGGMLAWVPLTMRLVPQMVQPRDGGTATLAYVVQLVFDGSPQQLLATVRDLLALRAPLIQEIRELEAGLHASPPVEESAEEAADTQAEFYPDNPDPAEDLPPAAPDAVGSDRAGPGVSATASADQRRAADPTAAPAAQIAEAMLADAGLSAPPTRREPKTRPALEQAIMRRLRALAPGDDARARQARHDLVRACWGKEGFQAIMALNDKTLRAGWDKLKGLAPAQPSAADEAPAARLAEDAPQAAQAAAPTAADLEALSQRYAAVGFAESYHARRAEVALVTPALYQEWVDVVEGLERMQAKAGPQTGEG